MSAFGMLMEGKVGDAIVRVVESVFGIKLPQPLADLVHKFSTDAGQVIWAAATVGVVDVKAGKTLSEVADDVLKALEAQGVAAAKADVLDALGLQVRAS